MKMQRIPKVEKKILVSPNTIVAHNTRQTIFENLMKDPLLLSMKDVLTMKVDSSVWDPMMLLYELLVRFNIKGPVRLPFKTWFYMQIKKGRYVPTMRARVQQSNVAM